MFISASKGQDLFPAKYPYEYGRKTSENYNNFYDIFALLWLEWNVIKAWNLALYY